MAVLEGCRKECRQIAARVMPLLTVQTDDDEYIGLSESLHMSLRLCTKITGLPLQVSGVSFSFIISYEYYNKFSSAAGCKVGVGCIKHNQLYQQLARVL